MYFDILQDVKTYDKDNLYKLCRDAEIASRVSPNESAINCRKAIEILAISVLADHKIFLNDMNKRLLKLDNLIGKIDYCFEKSFISSKAKDLLHSIRREANSIVHIGTKKDGEYIIVKDASVGQATKLVKNLYEAASDIFMGKVKAKKLDIDELPISTCEVVKKIERKSFEASDGRYNYICMEKNNNKYNWYYVRCFKKDSNAFKTRDNVIMDELWYGMHDSPRGIIRGEIENTSRECEFYYIKYCIHENAVSLRDREKLNLSSKDALYIVIKLIEGLISIQNVVDDTKIHHRRIRPEYIFVLKKKTSYDVKLGCFETSKIIKEDEDVPTVNTELFDTSEFNAFAPIEIRQNLIEDINEVDWEKVDVYSVGVLLIWMNMGDFSTASLDTDILEDKYSDDYLDFLEGLYENSLAEKPSLEEFLEASKEEMENLA
ncbi:MULTISPECIES: DUF4145 domain-containing protein [Clostridium]|uniref:DUF4145 domain-containing protein n=1 Tax=Clostridium TaxID=1485 RepID=UPI000825E1AC|nr:MULTISPECIES: DUF4145 domain-containing protein [Clostridium]PJI06848.1 hypothetical protein CUB90_02730 [Clostridium sp. CT7]